MELQKKDYEILEYIAEHPNIKREDFKAHFQSNDDFETRYVDLTKNLNLVILSYSPVDNTTVEVALTGEGHRVLQDYKEQHHKEIKRYRMNEFRAWATLVIAISGVVLSIISLLR